MIEQKAFLITAFEKDGVTEIAHALAAHDYQIVSLGQTALKIQAAGIEVVSLEDLVADDAIANAAAHQEDETDRRDLLAQAVCLRLNQSSRMLSQRNIQPIHGAYINLRPPQIGSDNKNIKLDKGGLNYIAAGLAGGRVMFHENMDSGALMAMLNNGDDFTQTSARLLSASISYANEYWVNAHRLLRGRS